MSRVKIIVSRQAFETMVASAIEVYKKEVLGYIFGRKKGNEYRISHAIPLQTSERKYREAIFPVDERDKRIQSLDEFLNRELAGDFHSHTDFNGAPQDCISSHDREALRECPYSLSIIISVKTNVSRAYKWNHRRADRVVYGAIRNNGVVYGVLLSAYHKGADKMIRKARLIVPSLKKRSRC